MFRAEDIKQFCRGNGRKRQNVIAHGTTRWQNCNNHRM